MKTIKKALVLSASVLSLCAITTAARADDNPAAVLGGKITGNVAVTNNYIFRGVSQSNDGPAIQGGLTFTHDSGFYVGWWGSSVKEAFTGSSMENDFFVGYSGTIDAFTYDLGYIYYFYAGSSGNVGTSTDYSELYASGTYDFGVATLKAGVYYSFDSFAYHFNTGLGHGSTWYPYIETKIPVVKDGPLPLTIFAHYGVFVTEKHKTLADLNLNDWNVGVSTNLLGLDISLGYYDTNKDDYAFGTNGEHLAKAKFAAVVSKSF